MKEHERTLLSVLAGVCCVKWMSRHWVVAALPESGFSSNASACSTQCALIHFDSVDSTA